MLPPLYINCVFIFEETPFYSGRPTVLPPHFTKSIFISDADPFQTGTGIATLYLLYLQL